MIQPIPFFNRIINLKILLHITFWLSILFAVYVSEHWEHNLNYTFSSFLHYMLAFVVFVMVSYFNLYYLLPKYFKQKRFFAYFLWLTIISIFSVLLIILLNYGFQKIFSSYQFDSHSISNHKHFTLFYFSHLILSQSAFLVLTFLFFMMEEWIKLQGLTIKIQEIEGQKTKSELQALKAQINPHFLFNTLNNIYSHSLETSPKISGMIMKLSELMSYILYECHEERVDIRNELNFIRNYIELEKLRFEDLLQVELEISERDSHQKIVPLIFIAFVENAFKHVGHKEKNKQYVRVKIEINPGQILFKVVNSVSGETRAVVKESGIGIENVRKRLELLYPNNHTLNISKTEEEFKVELTINLNGA